VQGFVPTNEPGGKKTMTVTNDFNEILLNRRSVKQYDTSVKISKEEMIEILAKAMRAPSTSNTQTYRFVVIDTPEGKEKLAKLAPHNLSQVTTSSAVIAIFGDLHASEKFEKMFSKTVELGFMPEEIKNQLQPMLMQRVAHMTERELRDWVLTDAGLVAMQFMLVARSHGYETNPMGGYDKENIAETFGLKKERYVPVMIISVGKAAAEGRGSYRFPADEVTFWR
jgi:nitroreductase